MKIVCVVSVVLSGGVAAPAMAARSDMSSYAYFDAAGNFVGQSLWSCENKHFEGGEVTSYMVAQTYPCYPGYEGDQQSGWEPADVWSHLPPGITQDQACAVLANKGDSCGFAPNYSPAVFVYQ
jgi:hypothetical protein